MLSIFKIFGETFFFLSEKKKKLKKRAIETVTLTIKMPTFPQLLGFSEREREREITGVNSSIKQ